MAVAFTLMDASPAVTEAARTYISVRIWSAPFALANYAVLGSLIGRGRTDLGLALQVFINLTKIGLTLVAVPVLGLGIAGAASATVAAELVGAAAGIAVRFASAACRVGWDCARSSRLRRCGACCSSTATSPSAR